MLELMEKWLSLFWHSAMFVLPEWDNNAVRTVDYSLYYDNASLIKFNDQQAYGLFFTPNWNFWDRNNVWDKLVRSIATADWYISSLYVDIDMRDSTYSDPDKLLKYILDTIKLDMLPVQYIMKSWWWFHLYMFIEEAYRYQVSKDFWSKFKEIQESIADIFDWWCKNSHSVAKLMRMPFSKHRRSLPAKDTKLYKVIHWDELTVEEVSKVEDIVLNPKLNLNSDHIQHYINNIAEVVVKKQKSWEYIWDIGSAQINVIPILDIMERLKKYPREYMGKLYEFYLKWDKIHLKIDWQVYIPEWYKINRRENYVNNFSFAEHPADERPRGPVFPFLYNYFKKDITQLNKFLTDEFWISLMKWWSEGESYICLPTETWYIYFTDKWVLYGKSVFNKKAKTYEDIQIKLFDSPIFIKGIIRTDYDLFWETEEKNLYYMFYNPKTDQEVIIEYMTDRKAFNKKYWKKGLIFFGWEFDLIDFYNAINKAADTHVIKEYDFRYLNGWYEDWFIMGEDFYDRDANIIDYTNSDLIIKTPSIPLSVDNKEVSISEFWDRLRKVFSDRATMLSLTTFIALALWHKFRTPVLKKYKQQVLLPGLFLSWITKSWKTTLLTMLKNGLWITFEARKYSVIWTSPQPLKQAATDDFILHLEEFTWQIWDIKETIIRDIINKARTARGMADWNNTFYVFRSWLILDGEHLPKSASVANRCILIPMFDNNKEKIGTEKSLWDMIWISFLKDFIKGSYNYKQHEVLQIFKDCEAALSKRWIRDRRLLLYTFLLTVNRMYNIFMEDELIAAMEDNIEMLESIEKTNNVLWNLLSELIIRQKIFPTITKKDTHWLITVPYTMELRAQNMVAFIDTVKQYPDNVKVIWNNINIKIFIEYDRVANTKENVSIYNTIIPYKTYFREANFLDFIEVE